MRDEAQLLNRWLLGDAHAVALCQALGRVTQVWDDLIDGDEEVSRAQINDTFLTLLSELWRNPFLLRHHLELVPAIEQWIFDWHASNVLCRQKHSGLQAASYTIRDNSALVIVRCAYLLGGARHAARVAVAARAHLHDEPFEQWREGVRDG